ncbi:hypothetical protein [Salinibacterium sp.]|uniref:flavodoxin family protein n=1 Tax=Salinibacterium sp. TaxID=1915057 RepID=UPI00286CEE61|nr:hypothetical protein [Salinibacterium sp.]
MRAIIVFESLWGNTEKIARAIGRGLDPTLSVDIVSSDAAPDSLEGYDLVAAGGPTHAFSMTRAATRNEAALHHGAPFVPARGIREWIDGLSPVTSPLRAVTFDTRVDAPRLPGSAAKAARHELRSLGFDVATKPHSFRVHGYEGPLVDGELARAEKWARGLAGSLVGGVTHVA